MRTNWAGNYTYQAPDLWRVATIAEAQERIAAAQKVRVLGTRHSFNAIADSAGAQLSLEALDRVISVDAAEGRVTVEGGIRYGDLAPRLASEGLALANLASLPHISVAGAVATGTHGSGSGTGSLATAVTAMDLVTASGDILTLSREATPDIFAGAVIGLGALGAVGRLTLDVEPSYRVAQSVFTGLPHDVLGAEFDAIFASAKSVSVFTDWRGADTSAVWLKERIADGADGPAPRADFFGATPAPGPMHPLPGGAASDCTEQMGRPGSWHDRLPHFRMEFTPSNGAEIQAEFFLPREMAGRAVAAMRAHGDRLAPVLMVCELRTVAADDLWLSPGRQGPYFGIHLTFRRDWDAIRAILPAIEADLAPLGAVPHWGKVTTMDPALVASRFPKMADFVDLARTLDPAGKFRNDHVDRMVFGAV